MRALLTGSTGMVGSLVQANCLASPKISAAISLVRRPTSSAGHPKLKEIVRSDFADYSGEEAAFADIDVAFFCIGAYTGQVSQEAFKRITVDFAVAFAKTLKQHSPQATLCLLSGAGADRTEKSRTDFARFKGMAENQISALGLSFYSFRPGYIYPVTPRKEPNVFYRLSRTLYPLFKLMGSNMSIQSTELAQAMFNVGLAGADQEILENRDILQQL